MLEGGLGAAEAVESTNLLLASEVNWIEKSANVAAEADCLVPACEHSDLTSSAKKL